MEAKTPDHRRIPTAKVLVSNSAAADRRDWVMVVSKEGASAGMPNHHDTSRAKANAAVKVLMKEHTTAAATARDTANSNTQA